MRARPGGAGLSVLPSHPPLSAQAKRSRAEGEEEEEEAGAGGAAGGVPASAGKANKILVCEGLPEATRAEMLTLLFKQFPGFGEVRMVEAKPGIAFVEFESELHAGAALAGLNGFKISAQHSLAITFALH